MEVTKAISDSFRSTYAGLREALRPRLDGRRFRHVLGVESTAIALARRHGVDPGRAGIAALLHDYHKQDDERTLRRFLSEKDAPVQLTEEDWEHPSIWHGFAAARTARELYCIEDPAVLEAVAMHSTGNPGLSQLGLILYVADYLEPTRDFIGAPEARATLLPLPLREAAGHIAKLKVERLRRKERPVHSRTDRMAEWLESKR